MNAVFVLRGIQWIAIAILFFLLVYSVTRKPSEMQKHVIVLTISTIISLIGYTIEMDAGCLESALRGTAVSYIGKPFVMLSSYMLVSTFYGHKIPKRRFVILAALSCFYFLLVYTNEYHHLYYATTGFVENAKFTPLVLTHGPLYYTYVAASVIFFLACILVIVRGYRKSKSPMRRRLSYYSILMVVSGMLGYLIYLMGLSGGYDATMLGISVASFFLFMLFFRCKIFDVIDMAKDYALDVSPDALIVFDDANEVVYENAFAKDLVAQGITKEVINNFQFGTTQYTFNNNIYAVHVKEIIERKDHLGKSVEIHDITDSFNHQARLEEAVKDRTEKLETMQRTIFGSMASIVEARSLETGDHIRRVSEYTGMIANALRSNEKYKDILTDDYINTLVLSAPLHDIGKISVSDSILLKPGKLTPEEFSEMKKHSASGAQIIRTTMVGLESEEYINMAATIALYHHEWWDGSGYPAGLIGDRIPICARIVALADCYDALTSQRCYKEAFPDSTAIRIIKEESGSHFDPEVVEAFLSIKH